MIVWKEQWQFARFLKTKNYKKIYGCQEIQPKFFSVYAEYIIKLNENEASNIIL